MGLMQFFVKLLIHFQGANLYKSPYEDQNQSPTVVSGWSWRSIFCCCCNGCNSSCGNSKNTSTGDKSKPSTDSSDKSKEDKSASNLKVED
nr:hypothetical protein MACL_00002229 [Theileria orientalis]